MTFIEKDFSPEEYEKALDEWLAKMNSTKNDFKIDNKG